MSARRARGFATAVAALAVSGAMGVACLIVDTPSNIPPLVKHRPLIIHTSVTPPTTQVLERWPPGGFNIPIEVLDPTATIAWHAFIDYDRVASIGFSSGTIEPDPASEDGGVRMLNPGLAPPNDITACHVIEVIVANTFVENHTPDSFGADSVSWFYAPSGSLDGCPTFDSGAPLDGGTE